MRDAIRLSSHLTSNDPEQLAGQLVGRLTAAATDHPTIADFNRRVANTRRQPCLIPRNGILNQAGGPLIRTLQGHHSGVTSVCVTPDGRHVVSGSWNHTLKVRDLRTGRPIATYTAEHALSSCDISPYGRTVLAGESSGRLHFLTLAGLDSNP